MTHPAVIDAKPAGPLREGGIKRAVESERNIRKSRPVNVAAPGRDKGAVNVRDAVCAVVLVITRRPHCEIFLELLAQAEEICITYPRVSRRGCYHERHGYRPFVMHDHVNVHAVPAWRRTDGDARVVYERHLPEHPLAF